MTIHAPLNGRTGGYSDVIATAKRELEKLNFNPPEMNLLLSVPQDNVNALVQFTMWETTRLLPLQVGILNTRRLVIVPNERDAEDFAMSGVTAPIRVCPLYCTGQFTPFPAIRPFRFVHIGSEYGIPSRKRQHEIVAAFKAAFPTEPDVELVIKRDKSCSKIANFDSRITIIDDQLSIAQLHALYSNCHVGIFPGGMESWGLPIAELAATGRASITPIYRGTAEFLDHVSAFALQYHMVRAPKEAFCQSGEVAEVPFDGIIHAMRFAYYNPLEVYRRGLAAYAKAQWFTPARFGAKLADILNDYACESGNYVVGCGKADRGGSVVVPASLATNLAEVRDAIATSLSVQPN